MADSWEEAVELLSMWGEDTKILAGGQIQKVRFGGINWPGFVGFLIGIAVSIPFMAADLYHGPIGNALGGADISYFVPFLVAGGVYFVLQRPAVRLATHSRAG